MTFCITGKLKEMSREEAAWLIAKSGNRFCRDLVKSEVDCLVMADPSSQSGKAVKARQWGIRCIGEEELRRLCGFSREECIQLHEERAKAEREKPVTWEKLCKAICRRVGGLTCRCQSEWLSDYASKASQGRLIMLGRSADGRMHEKVWCSCYSWPSMSAPQLQTREVVFESLVRQLFSTEKRKQASDMRHQQMRIRREMDAIKTLSSAAADSCHPAYCPPYGWCKEASDIYAKLPDVGEFTSPIELKLKLEIAGWSGMLTEEDLAGDGEDGFEQKGSGR